jgi:6-pyruvoyltetrahydropterin/6-carboxytetrahydropterin synthase
MFVKCPVCGQIFSNDVELYDHYMLLKFTNKFIENDAHVIYLNEMYGFIKSYLRNDDLSRRQIINLLLDDRFVATENDVYSVERFEFPGRSLCRFYGIPYNKFAEYNKTPLSDYTINKIMLKAVKDIGFEGLQSCNYPDGSCKDEVEKFVPVDGNPRNHLLSNIGKVYCEKHYKLQPMGCKRTIMKEFTFDSAHHLLGYQGKCRFPHGHTYKLKVFIESFVSMETDMVMDSTILKERVNEVIRILDHANLNEKLGDLNTTSENIILWIWVELEMRGLKGISKLELFETPTTCTILTKEQLLEDKLYVWGLKHSR